ncbi:MAG: aminoacyl-tRNA deacylase [Rhodospirillaceae bacterium]|nr:aminoacyl-tRNA deacylase [Rhodospirillaceae bacterium]|tara:strand:+ start:3556 stop:4095 length:540 start_codon:yes stop_codon:yes gene_type:complete
MTILENPAVKRVESSLRQSGSESRIIELQDTARSANDAASSIGTELGSIVKSLLFSIDSEPVMTLIAGDMLCDMENLNKVFDIEGKIIRLDAKTVRSVTGFSIGGVAPIGHLTNIPVVIDGSLKRFRTLYAAAGHPHCVFATTFTELKKITKGLVSEEVSIMAVDPDGCKDLNLNLNKL